MLGRKLALISMLNALLLASTPSIGSAQSAATPLPVDSAVTAASQAETESVVTPLRDSEADSATGSYIPGIGALFILELVRGPNSLPGKTPYQGVRDWATYLLATYGPLLRSVPPSERIAISIRFYDFDDNIFHTLITEGNAGTIADPTTYAIWLDGMPYFEAVAILSGGPFPTRTPLPDSVEPAISLPPATPQAVNAELRFDDPTEADAWFPVAGTWVVENGTYAQTELARFDLVSYYRAPVAGNFKLTVNVRHVKGVMGAGLVFAAPDASSNANAQMVSFAGDGNFLQWGHYSKDGVFQYAGGQPVVPSANDNDWHTLVIAVQDGSWSVGLDGKTIGSRIPLEDGSTGYLGLLSSTSHTQFNDIEIEALP